MARGWHWVPMRTKRGQQRGGGGEKNTDSGPVASNCERARASAQKQTKKEANILIFDANHSITQCSHRAIATNAALPPNARSGDDNRRRAHPEDIALDDLGREERGSPFEEVEGEAKRMRPSQRRVECCEFTEGEDRGMTGVFGMERR